MVVLRLDVKQCQYILLLLILIFTPAISRESFGFSREIISKNLLWKHFPAAPQGLGIGKRAAPGEFILWYL